MIGRTVRRAGSNGRARRLSTPRRLVLALCAASAMLGAVPLVAWASSWDEGDVFAAVGNGQYNVYDNSGVFKETISQGVGGFTTGCAFDSSDDFYGTNFSSAAVIKQDNDHPHGVLQTISLGAQGAGGTESIVFAADGSFYVGNADGDRNVYHYDAAGNLIGEFDVATEDRGSDWIDLATDQQTLFYTSEGQQVKRYDVSANTQLSDFALLPGAGFGAIAYAFRLLPPGDGSGGLLVAQTSDIKRLDGSGNVVQTYDAPGEDGWFALNLDPNGTSFWSGSFFTTNFYRFNIATGAVEVGPITAGGQHFGLCLLGELTASQPPVELSIDDVTVTEGDSGTTPADFKVSLSQASANPVTVDFDTANVTALASSDYVATSGTLTFAAGETEKTVSVPVKGDVVNEPDETFFVNLTNASGATIADDQGVGTILDDDREGTFSCRAQALRFGPNPLQQSKVANPPVNPCADDEKSELLTLTGTVGSLMITSKTLHAQTNLTPDDQSLDPAPGDRGEGEASVEKLVIKGSRTVTIRGITAHAAARCRLDGQGNLAPVLRSSSSVASVQMGSQTPVPIGDNKVTIPLGGLGTLYLNPVAVVTVNAPGAVIVQRAVWLDRPAGQHDVIVAEAQGDYHGNPCTV